MLKSLLCTMSGIVLAGGLVAQGPAMAADSGPKSGKVAASMDSDPKEPNARFDIERSCAEVGMVPRRNGDARSDPTEARPRFDAARDCIAMDADPRDPSVNKDVDPTEPPKRYN